MRLVYPSNPTQRVLNYCEGQTIDLAQTPVYDASGKPWGVPDGRIRNIQPLVAHFHRLFLVDQGACVSVSVDGSSAKEEAYLLIVGQARISRIPMCIVYCCASSSLRFVQQIRLSLKLVPEIRHTGTEDGRPLSFILLPEPYNFGDHRNVLGVTVRGRTPYAVIHHGDGLRLEDTTVLGAPPAVDVALREHAELYAFWNQGRPEVARSHPLQ